MKRCFLLLFLPVVLFMLGACSEKEEPNPEYANWAARNDAAFADSLRTARNAIAQARAKWGDACCAIISSVPTQKPTAAIR